MKNYQTPEFYLVKFGKKEVLSASAHGIIWSENWLVGEEEL